MPNMITLDEIRSWPATIDVRTASKALGISGSHGYALAKRNEFPCRIIPAGTRIRVVTASLLQLLTETQASDDQPGAA